MEDTLRPVLVVGRDFVTLEAILRDVRQLTQVAIWIDSCETAREMMQVVEFAVVVVDVEGPTDWRVCRRLAVPRNRRIAVVTRLLAPDRHHRETAFAMGVAAYVCKPCTRARLRAMLKRVQAGEPRIELVDGARYCESRAE